MAYYELQESNLPNEDGRRIKFPRLKLTGQISTDQIAEAIAHASTFTPGEVKGLIQSLATEIADAMSRGCSVKIDGIGIFTPAVEVAGKHGKQDACTAGREVDARDLCIGNIRFKADKELLRRTDEQCRLERAPEKFRRSSRQHTPDERLKMAQTYLDTHPVMTIDDYCKLTGLLRYSASKELKRWSDDPASGITSTGRNTHKVYVKG